MGEWENRELCPDGACLGLIGTTGTCNVCGRKGVRPAVAGVDRDDDDVAAPAAEPAAAPTAAPARPEAVSGASPDDWDQRALCPDGSCIGVIAASGTCTVCGRTGV